MCIQGGIERIANNPPDILISNPWTVKERLLHPEEKYQELYKSRRLIILDEAHVYTNVNYAPLTTVLRLLIQLQKLEARENEPIIIASSATIPLQDRRDLLRWMLNVDKSCVEDVDYDKLEPKRGNLRRLKIFITALPYRQSIETLLQGILQLLLLIQINRNFKSIVFVDSISEVATLTDYLNTILVFRRGSEICDHINSSPCRSTKDDLIRPRKCIEEGYRYVDYSWSHLINVKDYRNLEDLLNKIQQLRDIIGIHHGGLNEEQRRSVEEGFARSSKRVLIATSTLDLGMDYDDVAFVVQYKNPISDESLEQRAGRAGRKGFTYRISLVFYIPTLTPSLIQRMYRGEFNRGTQVVLPDELVLELAYLYQVLEYEVIQSLKEYLGGSKRLSLKKIKQIIVEYVVRNLNSYSIDELVKKKWNIRKELVKQLNPLMAKDLLLMLSSGDEVMKYWNKLRKDVRERIKDYKGREKIAELIDRMQDEVKIRFKFTISKNEIEEYAKEILKEITRMLESIDNKMTNLENNIKLPVLPQILQKEMGGFLQHLEDLLKHKESESLCEVLKQILERQKNDVTTVRVLLPSIMKSCIGPIIYNEEVNNIKKVLSDKIKQLKNYTQSNPMALVMISSIKNFGRDEYEKCREIGYSNFARCWYTVLRDIFSNIISKIVPPSFAWEGVDTVYLKIDKV